MSCTIDNMMSDSKEGLMKTEIKMCPTCSEPIPNREHAGKYCGAISRKDNVTEICSECGNAEAMAEYFSWSDDIKAEIEAIEKSIAVGNANLIEIENQISINKTNGNTSLALMLDARADSILKGIFSLKLRLQKLQ
jgi:hypothetical protein